LVAAQLSQEVLVQLALALMKQQRIAASLLICKSLRAHSLHAQELQSPPRISLSLKVRVPNTCQVTHSPEPKNLGRSTTMVATLPLLAVLELLDTAHMST
jgi:hypothetical protein